MTLDYPLNIEVLLEGDRTYKIHELPRNSNYLCVRFEQDYLLWVDKKTLKISLMERFHIDKAEQIWATCENCKQDFSFLDGMIMCEKCGVEWKHQ